MLFACDSWCTDLRWGEGELTEQIRELNSDKTRSLLKLRELQNQLQVQSDETGAEYARMVSRNGNAGFKDDLTELKTQIQLLIDLNVNSGAVLLQQHQADESSRQLEHELVAMQSELELREQMTFESQEPGEKHASTASSRQLEHELVAMQSELELMTKQKVQLVSDQSNMMDCYAELQRECASSHAQLVLANSRRPKVSAKQRQRRRSEVEASEARAASTELRDLKAAFNSLKTEHELLRQENRALSQRLQSPHPSPALVAAPNSSLSRSRGSSFSQPSPVLGPKLNASLNAGPAWQY